ncbi:MAG: large conductance mechanosensitive channel protein MscL [Acidobacteriales bacterium]|nr:large conductance mechanosensitive channel protein MscL [Terriglobales bacterium]
MIKGFKEFLLKNQVLGLAIAVIIGGAIGKVVSSLVADIIMPLISLLIPGGEWRTAKMILSKTVGADGKEVVNAVSYGSFVGSIVDFIVIAFCIYMITKSFIKEEAPAPAAPVKVCPRCKETVAAEASKCKFCCSDI